MAADDTDDNAIPADPEAALTSRQVSVLVGLSPITLDQMRYRGDGPAFFRAGSRHIRYRRADVIAWRDARTVGKRL